MRLWKKINTLFLVVFAKISNLFWHLFYLKQSKISINLEEIMFYLPMSFDAHFCCVLFIHFHDGAIPHSLSKLAPALPQVIKNLQINCCT